MTEQPTTLFELVEVRGEQRSQQRLFTYLVDGETSEAHMTYGELAARCRAIGSAIAERTSAGDRALLLYPPGLEYVEAFFACQHAGVIAVPAYPPNPAALERTLPRLVAIMQSSGASLILTTSAVAEMARQFLADLPEFHSARWLAK